MLNPQMCPKTVDESMSFGQFAFFSWYMPVIYSLRKRKLEPEKAGEMAKRYHVHYGSCLKLFTNW